MGSSPLSVPTGSPGAAAGAMAKVREAINILNMAISELPIGTDPHKAVMSAVQGLTKVVPPSADVPGVQQTALRDLQANAGKSAMMQKLMASLGAGGAQPGGGPPLPPPAQPGA